MALQHSPVRNLPANEAEANVNQCGDGNFNTSIGARGEIATSSLQKLPPFWADQPRLWFIQIESIFSLSRITRDETKYSQVIANFEPSYLKFIGDILVAPPETGKYEAIKERLISSFEVSEESKLKKLFGGLILGDQKPSHFLRSMKALACGNNIGNNVLKTLFLDQLPDNVKSILATSNVELEELALQADKILEIARPQISSICADNAIAALTAKIDALDHKFNNSFRGRSRERRRSQSKGRTEKSVGKDWCWYHRRFKSKATKCNLPCTYNKKKLSEVLGSAAPETLQNSSGRLQIRDINSNRIFLIDTGADVSVIPLQNYLNSNYKNFHFNCMLLTDQKSRYLALNFWN